MLQFRETADHHSRDVVRIGNIEEDIGSIQWHPGSEKRLVIHLDVFEAITLNELRLIVQELEKK